MQNRRVRDVIGIIILIVLILSIGGESFPTNIQEVNGFDPSFSENFTTSTYTDFGNTTVKGWEEHSGEISLPKSFSKEGSEDLLEPAHSFAITEHAGDKYAFFTEEESMGGLEIVEISSSSQPQSVKWINTNFSLDVKYQMTSFGDYLCLTNYYIDSVDFTLTSYFTILDVADPLNPIPIGSVSNQTDFSSEFFIMADINIEGEWVYVLAYHFNPAFEHTSYSMMSINITDVTDPILESSFRIPVSFQFTGFDFNIDTFLLSNHLFVPDGYQGFYIFDISDPTHLTLSANFTIGSKPTTIFVVDDSSGDYAYLCDLDQGLHIIDVSSPTNPVFLTTYSTPQKVHSVWVDSYWADKTEGYIVYGDTFQAGFQVFDLRNPSNPIQIATISLSGAHPQEYLSIFRDKDAIYVFGLIFEIFDTGYYESSATAQSTTMFATYGSVFFEYAILWELECEIPFGTSIDFFLSSDGGIHWEIISQGEWLYFSQEGFDLRWKTILQTDYLESTPRITKISCEYHISQLDPPTLLAPLEGWMTFDNTPTLVWEGFPDAEYYHLQLDRSPTFDSPDLREKGLITESSYTVTYEGPSPQMRELTPGIWFWRVGTKSLYDEWGYTSTIQSFLVDSINHPVDVDYAFGTSGHIITWTPLSSEPESFQVYKDGTWIAEGSWQGDPITISIDGLPLGPHNYTCTAYDLTGNDVNDTVTVLVTPRPEILITSPIATTYTTETISVELAGEAEHYWYKIENIDNSNHTWITSVQRSLLDGTYVLHAYSNNSFGNIAYTNVTFSIDTTPPSLSILSPTSKIYSTNTISVSITGDADDYWYFIESVDNQNHTWTTTVSRTLVDGTYTLHAYGSDTAGNIAYSSITFTIQNIESTSSTTLGTTTTLSSTTSASSPSWNVVIVIFTFVVVFSRKTRNT